jgi:hypothetical protein
MTILIIHLLSCIISIATKENSMPLIPPVAAKEIEAIVLSELTASFPEGAAADPTAHAKLAKVAGIIGSTVLTIISRDALVMPGIATSGSPVAQVSSSPGIIK